MFHSKRNQLFSCLWMVQSLSILTTTGLLIFPGIKKERVTWLLLFRFTEHQTTTYALCWQICPSSSLLPFWWSIKPDDFAKSWSMAVYTLGYEIKHISFQLTYWMRFWALPTCLSSSCSIFFNNLPTCTLLTSTFKITRHYEKNDSAASHYIKSEVSKLLLPIKNAWISVLNEEN